MSLLDDLKSEVKTIFASVWTQRDGQKVPVPEDLKLANDAVKLDGVVLYADLRESTILVDTYKPEFAAEVYKVYLHCAAKIIRTEGGEITSYDGDRIMAVFLGDGKETNAARCALKINYAVREVINPALKAQYPTSTYEVKQAVGIDASSLFVARTGIRGANDLVWVGRAANYAAKLCSVRDGSIVSWITEPVFNKLADSAKYGGQERRLMWEARTWTAKNITIYGSTWQWGL